MLGMDVRVDAGRVALEGRLAVPDGAAGVVLFAHGGGARHSPRNRHVAASLHAASLGTLLVDLLTGEEEIEDELTREHRFDIPLLAQRLVDAVEWLGMRRETHDLPVGLFGAGTGGGAALVAAAEHPGVSAVVSRGGRLDLAGASLERVHVPTLLIVGELDEPVLALHREAHERLTCVKHLEIVEGATHLFLEPGALDEAARLAGDWFSRHLSLAPRGIVRLDEAA